MMTVFEWIGGGVLGLQSVALAWILKDYLSFRVNRVPDMMTANQCRQCRDGCQAPLTVTLDKINTELQQGRARFGSIDVRLAKICTALEVDCQ